MIFYIRDKQNNTLLDIEVFCKTDFETNKDYTEIRSIVSIAEYSTFLLSFTDKETQITIIAYFEAWSEIRGWFWEKYLLNKTNNYELLDELIPELRQMFNDFLSEYPFNGNLFLVEG